MRRFLFSPDKHVGFQNGKHGLEPLHDMKAIGAMLEFAADFKPDVWIEGGDNVDCGPVSHWLRNKKMQSKDLDLRKDMATYTRSVLNPVNKIMKRPGTRRVWMIGNHEAWLDEFADENPGAAEMVKPENLLDLDGWEIVDQGESIKLGKLYFVHGDNIGNTKHMADKAVQLYGHPVLFGHFHTYQVAPRHELVDIDAVKMGVSVPGLCNKNPAYMANRPNQWMKGFAYGYIHPDGSFQVYVPVIIGGKFAAEGKVYRG